jgi:tripartite-type tricarboxylate transporter receptor subunit TctC
MRLFFVRCLALLAPLLASAHAQDFSSRPIRIVVGLVAGGATDVTARLVAQKLTEALHTNVYVDNRPGGSSFRRPARSPARRRTAIRC